jgi:sporulation protein YlmC with PRC-barrel domain
MIQASRLLGKVIDALDGPIGSVDDVYFDEQSWKTRYLVIDTGKWLPGRKVLVVPEAIGEPWHDLRAIPLKLSREQIESSPEIDTAKPISRVAEDLLHRHYQWIPYWDLTTVPFPPAPPSQVSSQETRHEAEVEAEAITQERLCSANEIGGYNVHATDGDVGRVDDLLLDDDCSRVLFLAIETKGWLFGKTVLVGPSLVQRVDWANSTVYVSTTRAALKSAQEYNPAA